MEPAARSNFRAIAMPLAAAACFGLIFALVADRGAATYDTQAQIRTSIGNLSAPWVLLAFAVGTRRKAIRQGAAFGFVATLVALLAFYLLNTGLQNLGGHGVIGDLKLEVLGNRSFFEYGFVSGPIFGALGTSWRRTRSLGATFVAGALLAGEPIVLSVLGALPVPRDFSGFALSDAAHTTLTVYAAELVVGLLVMAGALKSRSVAGGQFDRRAS